MSVFRACCWLIHHQISTELYNYNVLYLGIVLFYKYMYMYFNQWTGTSSQLMKLHLYHSKKLCSSVFFPLPLFIQLNIITHSDAQLMKLHLHHSKKLCSSVFFPLPLFIQLNIIKPLKCPKNFRRHFANVLLG